MATENQQGASSVVARYYTRWYKTDLKSKPGEDHCVLQHSNSSGSSAEAELSAMISFVNLCHHTCRITSRFTKGRQIKSINYQISANCSRLQNKVSGKSKRGGQFLTEFAPLCRITCMDGEEYTVFSCIRGRLLEVNEDILMNPSLLQEKPSTEGYIAVVLPKFEESKSVTQGLLTQMEYEDILSKRRSTNPELCS